MGTCFSSERSIKEVAPKTIRVVHLDGSLQDYENPATVDQVMSNFPMHYLCTPVEIFQSGLIPLQPDYQLKTGQTYFILPNSTLKFNTTPDDLTILTRKLMNIAKTGRPCPVKLVPRSPLESPLCSPHGTSQRKIPCPVKLVPRSPLASPLCSPQGTSQSKFLDRRCGDFGDVSMLNSPKTPKSPQWKPVMETIIES